jgi:uncharacterized protein (TIGR00369 family)
MNGGKGVYMHDDKHARTVHWTDPATLGKTIRGLSGLDYLRGVRDGTIAKPPVDVLLDFSLIEVEEGRVVFEFSPSECHYNPFGTVQGGVTGALLDAAAGSAVFSTLPAGVGYTSLDLKANFIRPITADAGIIRCEARIIHSGTSIGLAEGRLTDEKGRLFVYGLSTCMIIRSGCK